MTDTLSDFRHRGAAHPNRSGEAAGALADQRGDRRERDNGYNAFLAAMREAITMTGAATPVWHQSSSASRRPHRGTRRARGAEEITPGGRRLVSCGPSSAKRAWRSPRRRGTDARPAFMLTRRNREVA